MFSCFRVRHNDDLKVRGSTAAVNLKLWLLCCSSSQAGIFKTDSSKYFSSFEILYTLLNFYSHNAGLDFLFKSLFQSIWLNRTCRNLEPKSCIFLLSVLMWCHLFFLPLNFRSRDPFFLLTPEKPASLSLKWKDWLLRTFSTDNAVRARDPVWKFL